MEKIKLEKDIHELNEVVDYHEYDILELIETLQLRRKQGAEKVYFSENYDNCGGIDDYTMSFTKFVLETDEEFARRKLYVKKQEEKQKEKQKEEERKKLIIIQKEKEMLKALQKKYPIME